MRRVAITGLGVVSAVGIGQAPFFDALLSARLGICAVEVPFLTGPELVVAGPVSLDLDSDDPATHISRARLITMDRVSQLALVASHEAITQAGLAVATDTLARERFGVIMGTGGGGAGSMDSAYTALLEHRALRLRPMTVVLSMSNAIAAHLSLEFDLRGPSNTISNACASSANAIGEAFRQIRHGYADVMLAGGAEAPLNRGTIKAWQAMNTLAKPHPDGPQAACRPFAKDRSGLVLADGAAVVVLEDWAHAMARGATILAELAGYATTTDAHHLTQPEAAGQARAMTLALADAQLSPSAIGYLNAHGTATDIGDVVETQSIRQAFGYHAETLAISSTKAVHGHAMGAAGAMEFVATVLALRAGQLPPTAFLQTADPRCGLDYIPLIARTHAGLTAVMSNSFAFGGSNAVLVAKKV